VQLEGVFLEVVERDKETKGCEVLAKRWLVERIFGKCEPEVSKGFRP
jgi:hypothetical protein